MPLEDLPHEIQEHILRTVGNECYQEKPNTYSLTMLLYCLRKTFYRKKHPKLLNLKSAYALYRGKLFDEKWSPLFRHNQVRCTYRCKTVPITISGKYDFLTTDNPEILVDLKTHKNLYFVNEPSEEYVKQVRFYAYLNSITKAQILYVDFGDAKKFDIEIGDVQHLLDELETKAAILYNAFKTNTVPPKETSWACDYCDYKTECNQETQPYKTRILNNNNGGN